MSGIVYSNQTALRVQADGATSLKKNGRMLAATAHQISVAPEAGATGTLAVEVKWSGRSDFIALKDDSDAAVVFNLATPVAPFRFEGVVEDIRYVPTSVTAGYRALAVGWN